MPSFLPSSDQLQNISLETGDFQTSLEKAGAEYQLVTPFYGFKTFLCSQRAQGWIYRQSPEAQECLAPWVRGSQQAAPASVLLPTGALPFPVAPPGGIDLGTKLYIRTEHLASLQLSFKRQSLPGCRRDDPP